MSRTPKQEWRKLLKTQEGLKVTWLFKKFDPGICLTKSQAQEKQALSHANQHPRGVGAAARPVCRDLPANLPPTVHLPSERRFQQGRWREQVRPGVGAGAGQPQRAPPAIRDLPSFPGQSSLRTGGKGRGAPPWLRQDGAGQEGSPWGRRGGRRWSLRHTASERRGVCRPSPRQKGPSTLQLHSPRNSWPRLRYNHVLPCSPKRQVVGDRKEREDDGSEGQYRDGRASPRPTGRPPGEPLWVTSNAHTILHLKSRTRKVKGAARSSPLSARPTEGPFAARSPTFQGPPLLSFQQTQDPRM